jgi:hypothetical protein
VQRSQHACCLRALAARAGAVPSVKDTHALAVSIAPHLTHTPPTMAARSRYAWRLVHAPEWAAIQEHGVFEGSAIDVRDGYLHMSPASEVKRTATIYFAGVTDLWLLKIGA